MSPRPSSRRAPPSKFYRAIALCFTTFVIILAATTSVLVFSRAHISLVLARKEHEVKFTVDVEKNVTAEPTMVSGVVTITPVTLESSFPVEKGETVEDHARGTITVVNGTARNQPLVATTRFLSSEGVLFRSTAAVTIFANESRDVPVRADIPGTRGDIGPSRFIIPGLWEGVQDKIFGESKSPMSGGMRRISKISSIDLEKARAALAAREAVELHETRAALGETSTVLSWVKIEEKVLTPEGKEADAARIQGVFTLTTVTYDHTALDAFIRKHAEAQFGDSSGRLSFLAPELAIVRAEGSRATLMVSQKVLVTPMPNDFTIDARLLKGKKKIEVARILMALPGIARADIALSPRFLRRLPRMADHITIMIQHEE